MDLKTFAEVLAVFPKSPQAAKTAVEISKEWELGTTPEARLKKVQRCIRELTPQQDEADDDEGYVATDMRDFVCKLPHLLGSESKAARVYLDMNAVAAYFLTDAVALQLMLGRSAINHTLLGDPALQSGDVERLARENLKRAKGDVAVLAGKVRLVPDSPPRLAPTVDPEVLRCVIVAMGRRLRLKCDYRASTGNEKSRIISPLGICSKDSTIYLIGLEGTFTEPGQALALHRIRNPQLTDMHFNPGRFDIDQYLARTGNLSHPQGNPDATILLELRVHPKAIWHFQERPIGGAHQVITAPTEADGWFHVSVETGNYYQWRPLLASFGPNIEVLAPDHLRDGPDGLGAWARAMAAHYPDPEKAID